MNPASKLLLLLGAGFGLYALTKKKATSTGTVVDFKGGGAVVVPGTAGTKVRVRWDPNSPWRYDLRDGTDDRIAASVTNSSMTLELLDTLRMGEDVFAQIDASDPSDPTGSMISGFMVRFTRGG